MAGLTHPSLDAVDRAIVLATQAGLPVCEEPYEAVAREVGISGYEVLVRLERMIASGVIRRVGLVPNHYALGYGANGMSVWDVEDGAVDTFGERIGALPYVTHCYRRPRQYDWPYNLFVMVHGHDRAEVEAKAAEIGRLLGPAARAHEILYSTRILKKTGLRLVKQQRG
jgi:DNA-binding Lrp family transcriptional regulator